MKKLLFSKLSILALLFIALYGNAQVVTAFRPIYQVTQKGGIVFLANSALGCSSNPAALGTSACQNGVAEFPPAGAYADNSFASAYIDIDGDPTTFMSSSDSLNLPDCSGITKAYLFWGANGNATPNRSTIKMKINTGAYRTITADSIKSNTAGYNTYHCFADVTSFLQSGGIKSRVTIADIPSSAITGTNTFGSWNLVVVYNNDLLTMRQLTIFKGLANVSNGSASIVNVPISGFLTPLTGSVSLELGVYVHDGDRSLSGDNLNFNGGNGFLPIIDALNPLADVMNSTVSNKGVLTPFRKPDMNNTAGLDADIFAPDNTLKTFIGNAATSATFQMTTSSETYLAQMITTAIDVYEPDLRASVKVTDVNGGLAVPGDILEYRVKGLNIGSDPSINTFITDTLDRNINYIPNSIKITYGPNPGLKTDAASDDQADYNPATRTIKVRIGTGANALTGGTVVNSSAGIDSTVFTYSVMVTENCVKISCDNIIDARAFIWGTGNVSGNTFNNGSNPGIFDINGCPIPGITSTPITATNCAAPTASANPTAFCSSGSFSLSVTTNTDVTYAWSGPGSFTANIQNPVVSSATASNAGVYTASLIAYPGCSQSATTSVALNSCPLAVPDASNTVINTPVSGSVGVNDTNTSGATFTITGQPANGTVAIDPATGQYTFTPAPTFTGVTTATYQICNGSPVVCANANITFTVYPNLTAVANTIVTTPSVNATGTLTTNDIGITPGANYSVSVTQPLTSTGTITVNASTGGYTFVPNPTFTGTTVTTYTVCNTSINPQQCSNTTITITVSGAPLAANDVTTTLINTPVTANASTNDGGVITGTFAITAQPATTSGTVSIDPATGIYTFTPTTGFTGTTQATYQLCNVLSPPCATAHITFTVYPNISAASNSIITTPSVAATGSLLANDPGVTPGANYSVSITQPPTSTGTITINTSTGEYTFTPNPAFTGTSSASYTVCNTSVNPQQCSNTSISISVGNTPLAVNDATNTVINTPVTASAATNDSGVLTGTFAITAQPATTSGTVSMNASTGVYTFTPTTGFTGTAQATYQLCNVLSPPCATANITFTVYPTLTAVANTIITTPSVTATGSLLTNDLGVTPGANYSVSITQPPTSTGTITINPSTGVYTFVPNPAFTGTDVASYTVCNISVNPQQCSNTTINIVVGNVPLAVNDATNTVINTPVTASASTNDSGVLTGTFAVTTQPATTSGTVSMNPSTGVYTFTPTTGFTGTAQATYQLCNALSPPCSTANITFTVYPNLVAVSNTIATVPSTSVTGGLLTNDIGITAGANYSVSVTQPATSTGTITFNAATGNYTFVPNATFTGSASTTYTVCNNSINPQQCSNTTIIITVGNTPLAVNDATNTAINTPVSGTASTNDSGIITGTFTIVTPPANGTMTMDPSNGAYSFTPATGFTGVTTATYQLCNVLSPPCSTAAISFTVYPNIVANPNVISTTPGVATSTNLLTNDGGITPGANYSVSVTPLLSTTGTLVVNPSTGVASFTPATGYTGTVQTTYTVCNTSINPQQCSNTTITINVVPAPIAVNDATTTLINTAITASAATNDTGVLTGTFTVITPPANGTMTMNPVTGVYSFTPATGFTGVTTATYQLCNAAAAPCGTASITFTVYPNLVATNDNTVAVPHVISTGSLLTNDPGVVTGGNYTVSITPVLPAIGAITVNPVTGVYSFTPAASFTGTFTTTYTVCNLSVNPVICSNASLTISTGALAVNDVTATAINVPVSGTVATNDINPTGGTFTVTTPSANGTFTLDHTTGQYTFTPATGFTGTTIVVYQLCNGSPSVCSNATVNITVFPGITATPDVINTTPSVTTTGTITSNDPGAVSTTTLGGTYSVSIEQLPPSTGTMIVIPGTGQYTFVPNTSFTGTASVTYTICNTSINPQQCSTSTIIINVVPPPVAVDDATTTIANTPVTANVTGNDTGLLTATLSIISQPNDGTVTIDPASGQYTFVPAAGFAGTTIAIYELCNFASPPCATAAIVFTVYPAVVSNTSTTFAGNPAHGNASTGNTPNTGLAYGTPSVVGTSNGTMVIAANGSYTFTPAAGFTGTTHYLVTVCNNTVVPPVCSVDTIYINVLPGLIPETLTVTSISTTTGNVLTNEPNSVQSGTVTTTPVSGPNHGTFTITPNGNFTYTPTNPDYSGYEVIVVTVCTGTLCTTNTINITVYPNLQPNTSTTPVNTPVAGNASTSNSPNTGLTYGTPAAVGTATNGTMTMLANGQYTFTPALNFTGTVQYVVSVCNNTVTPPICSNDTINVVVIPGLIPETVTVTIGSSVTGNVLTNEPTTVQAGTVSTTPLSGPHHGAINITPSGNFTYTPNNPDFSGRDTVLVTVCVGTVCATNTIIVTIYPQLSDDHGTNTPGSQEVTGNVLTNDHGTGLFNPTVIVNPIHGSVNMDPSGNYTYTPHNNYCGLDTFSYEVCDKSIPALCKTAFVFINISCDDEVFVPQGISPNGDNANDVLIVTGIEKYPGNKITIFNRWGNVVFEGNAEIDRWDGTSNKGTSVGDNKLPVGTYFYILDLKKDGKKNLKGYIYLQR